MTEGAANQHFLTCASWEASAAELIFAPLVPVHTAGRELESLRIHVRDYKLRDLPIGDRGLDAHYGAFVISQQLARDEPAARALALDRSYGPKAREITIGRHDARSYELGPEVPPDDIDGRSPAVSRGPTAASSTSWQAASSQRLTSSTLPGRSTTEAQQVVRQN